MSFSCSQCSFTAQFESALQMHRQLHHGCSSHLDLNPVASCKSSISRVSPPMSPVAGRRIKAVGRTSSATRLFSNLKARICKSKMLFAHPEELVGNADGNLSVGYPITMTSGCTSKGKVNSIMSTSLIMEDKETFRCHLCPFEADRITVLDRHLLNHHQIGLENLLKLVMAKTKDGLTENNTQIYGKLPYYKIQDEILEDGAFIIESVEPKIKILKHAATNTEVYTHSNIDDFNALANEIENLFKIKTKQDDGNNGGPDDDFMSKMAALNEHMCKFVDSSNMLKKVLNKELDSKVNLRKHLSGNEPIFNLALGDRDTPRGWERERAHSEKMERSRKHSENSRGDKEKLSTSDSYYF